MKTPEYTEAMERLGCRSDREAAELIGVSTRMACYYRQGSTIPLTVAKLVRMLLRESLRGMVSDSGQHGKSISGQL